MYDLLKEFICDETFVVKNISILTYYNSNKASVSITGTNKDGRINKFINTTCDVVEGYTGKELKELINSNQFFETMPGKIYNIKTYTDISSDLDEYVIKSGDNIFIAAHVILNDFPDCEPMVGDDVLFKIDRFAHVTEISFKDRETKMSVKELLYMSISYFKNILKGKKNG